MKVPLLLWQMGIDGKNRAPAALQTVRHKRSVGQSIYLGVPAFVLSGTLAYLSQISGEWA